MPTISIPLAECLLCDARRVEEGDTVRIHLNPDVFSGEVITEFSPVTAVVEEVRASVPPESVDAAMTIEVQVASEDLPDGVTSLTYDQILSVECLSCCVNLTERVEVLEESSVLAAVESWSSAADDGKVLVMVPGEDGLIRPARIELSSPGEPGIIRIEAAAAPFSGRIQFHRSGGSYLELKADSVTGTKEVQFPNATGTVALGDGSGITSQSSFRTALGLTGSAILAQNRILETETAITGLLGGGLSNLDGITTTTLSVPVRRLIYISGKFYIYELVAGTDAESSPAVIRPDDYNGASNAKVWKRRPEFTLSADITDSSSGGLGLADGAKLVKYGTGGILTSSDSLDIIDTTGTNKIQFAVGPSTALVVFTDGANPDTILFPAAPSNKLWTLPSTSGKYFALATAATGIPTAVDINWSATNDAATAGDIGEFVQTLVAAGSAVALTDATAADVASISLTAGDWDVEGWINFAATGGTVTGRVGSVSATSATHPIDGSQIHQGYQTTTTTETTSISLPRKRISLAATTTIYLVATGTFSAGSIGAFGGLNARRAR